MRERVRLLAVLALSLVHSTTAIKCLNCFGSDCSKRYCEGDVCVASMFTPRFGQTAFHEPTMLKGCMSGNLLRDDISSKCVSFDNDEAIQRCVCDGSDGCTKDATLDKLPSDAVSLVECVCVGKHCRGSSTCIGEMCIHFRNKGAKWDLKGCLNSSVPMLERQAIGTCMMPPMTGAMYLQTSNSPTTLLKSESCVCASDMCNENDLFANKKKTDKSQKQVCPASLSYSMHGRTRKSQTANCRGDICFTTSMNTTGEDLSSMSLQGCVHFTEEESQSEDFEDSGCAEFENKDLSVSACFEGKTKSRSAPKAKPAAKPKPKFVLHALQYALRSKERQIEIIQEPEEQEKKPNEETEEAAKDEDDEEGEEEGNDEDENADDKEISDGSEEGEPSKGDGNVIFESATQTPVPDESNVMMITIFVLIILVILAAGAVFKFQLHKRLTRSSYDTVAGG